MINTGEVSGVVEAVEQPVSGEVNSTQSLTGEVQHGSGVSGVRDVLVNEESIVDSDKIAHIDLTPYAETENVYDKDAIDTVLGQIDEALEGKADVDDIPTELADLNPDTDHNTVTEEQIYAWTNKADIEDIPTALSQLTNDDNYVQDESYVHTDNNFTNADKQAIGSIPTKTSDLNNDSDFVSDSSYVHTDNNFTDADKSRVDNIPDKVTDLSDVNVTNIQNGQVLKWDSATNKFVNANESGGSGTVTDVKVNNTSVVDGQGVANVDLTGYAKTADLGTAAAKNVPATGNASITEVVMGNDSRLTDARTPVSHTHTKSEITDFPSLGTASAKNSTNTVTQGSTDLVESGAVWSAIDSLPEPMIFKGTLGTGGTITTLPTASSSNEGFTYKVITDGTYSGKSAKVGDVFTSNGSEWVLIPSGDETFTDTWRNIKVNGTELLGNGIGTGAVNFKSGTNVTVSGSGNDITFSAQDTTYSKATAQADGLMSKEDFSKLSGIASGAEVNVQSDWNQATTTADDYIKNKPQNLVQDASYVHTDNNYTSTEKTKLSGIETGAQVNTITGVKGNAESSYRTGNVNITPTNIGLGNVDNTSDSTKKTNFTGSIASENTGFTTGGDVYTALQGKVNTETGKGLSTNDYTTAEKNKLSGISTGANKTEASTTNGNIKIDNVETPVYRNYGNNTVLQTDKTPFLTRQTLNPTGFSSYVREKLIGCSVAWNQLVDKTKLAASSSSNGITMTNNGDGSLSFTGTGNGSQPNFIITADTASYIPNHVYLMCGCPSGGSDSTFFLIDTDNHVADYGNGVLVKPTSVHTFTSALRIRFGNTYAISGTLKFWVQLTDLTIDFGSDVANHLYNLANNGGIDWLRNHNYPIDQYTQYGYGLYSSKPSAKKVVGFNVWDEEWEAGGINVSTGANETDNRIRSKNPIPVLPNTSYYCKDVAWVLEYDASGNYLGIYVGGNTVFTTSANTRYLKFKSGSGITTYANNITVNISDTNKNGTYEPYSCTTYSLGNTELRGHLIVQNGEIVAEGDVRESNGKITRVMYHENLGELTWSKSSYGFFYATLSYDSVANTIKAVNEKYVRCSDTGQSIYSNTENKVFGVASQYIGNQLNRIYIRDNDYSDATTFKNSLTDIYCDYELATPTTETSSPFADPMSLNGCTTEEYVDDRTIPVPVGHETQYMGQSEDVVEIPSGSLSDGKRKFVAETSGGKTQYYWEDEISDKPKKTTTINLAAYSSSLNRFEVPCDGYIMARVEPGEGAFSMNLSDYYEELLDAKVVYSPEHNTYFSFYVKKGMKYYYANSQGLTVSIAFRGIT